MFLTQGDRLLQGILIHADSCELQCNGRNGLFIFIVHGGVREPFYFSREISNLVCSFLGVIIHGPMGIFSKHILYEITFTEPVPFHCFIQVFVEVFALIRNLGELNLKSILVHRLEFFNHVSGPFMSF